MINLDLDYYFKLQQININEELRIMSKIDKYDLKIDNYKLILCRHIDYYLYNGNILIEGKLEEINYYIDRLISLKSFL